MLDRKKYHKIKKEKSLPKITEDDIQFDIPDTWAWCYIGDVFQHNTGKALNGTNRDGTILQYITTSNLYWNRFELEKLKEMPFTDAEVEKCTIQKGDLLVCEGGDCGRAAIWTYEMPMRIQNHIHRLRPYSEVCVDYFYYVFYLYKNAGWIAGKGIGIQGLSSNALHTIVAPLPPLAEQKRIVAKLEKILPLIDRYEAAWNKLEAFNKRFPGDMQKSILQLAIQGKLVEQRPEEGTGEELFQQIQAKKQVLIKAGKIKKEKPLDEIKEEEMPFDIPKTWKWVSVGSVCVNIQYGSSQKSSVTGKVPVLRMGNIQNGRLVWDKLVYTSDDEEISKYPLQYNDLLFNRTNSKELVGKTAIYKCEFPAIYAGYLVRVTPLQIFDAATPEQDMELRNLIKDLREGGYISVQWGGNKPYRVIINNAAKTYHEQLEYYEATLAARHQPAYIIHDNSVTIGNGNNISNTTIAGKIENESKQEKEDIAVFENLSLQLEEISTIISEVETE